MQHNGNISKKSLEYKFRDLFWKIGLSLSAFLGDQPFFPDLPVTLKSNSITCHPRHFFAILFTHFRFRMPGEWKKSCVYMPGEPTCPSYTTKLKIML